MRWEIYYVSQQSGGTLRQVAADCWVATVQSFAAAKFCRDIQAPSKS